jgi:hypothetical protein
MMHRFEIAAIGDVATLPPDGKRLDEELQERADLGRHQLR